MMNNIFINYRRSDTGALAGRIHDHIKKNLSHREVFLDISSIRIGENFESKIIKELRKSSVIIVLIGERWLLTEKKTGHPRIFNKNDYVRLEICWALKNNKKIIPVFFNNAKMPDPKKLPPDIREIAKINGAEIRNSRFNDDIDNIMNVIDKDLYKKKSLKMNDRNWLSNTIYIILGGLGGITILLLVLDTLKRITGEPASSYFGLIGSTLLIPIVSFIGGYWGYKFNKNR